MASQNEDEIVGVKVKEGKASLPRRIWRARRIAGRVALRNLKKDVDTGRWKCKVVDTVTGGFEKIETPYRDKARAWEFAIEFAWAWARDHGLVDRETNDGTFRTAWKRWCREMSCRATTLHNYKLQGKMLEKHMPSSIATITKQDVINWIKHLESTGSNGNTIAWRLCVLRMFLRWAKEESYLDNNPARYVRGPRPEPRVGIALSYEEARRLLACARAPEVRKIGKFKRKITPKQHVYWFLLISLHTGLRKSNVLKLRWSMIDLNERKITLPGRLMKNRRNLVIPIHKELELKLRTYRSHRASDIVLGRELNDIADSFKTAKNKAGLGNLVIHDLRHTASTWFHMKLPWNYVETLLGRKIPAVGAVYFHPPFWDLRNRIDELPWIEGQPPGGDAPVPDDDV